jgi:cation diffusion facilitator CzcD-associated flavoprotein CzcO
MPYVQEPDVHVPDHPQCDPQKIRIIHVGMGAAGMLCAFKARRMLTNYELICYEKNDDVGGKYAWSKPEVCILTIYRHMVCHY